MTRLSNRQYPMLQTFVNQAAGWYMTIPQAQEYDQRPFRSMLIQGWIAYAPTRGFHITRKGRAAWQEFQSTEIHRKNPLLPLTSYFDPNAYGLRKLHVMKGKVA
jgi:hypothetical protein